MIVKRIFTEDLKIAQAILSHDENVTRNFFYKQCYPLFKSIYDNYHTDCTCCKEFIDEIYLLVLSPSKTTGKCQMENFRGESTLTSWLKASSLYYCYGKFERKMRINSVDPNLILNEGDDERNDVRNDRLIEKGNYIYMDLSNLDIMDIQAILKMMPSQRYSLLIRLRYLEHNSNEETASLLGVSMEIFYNMHKRAKLQYEQVCRKEEHNG